MENLRVLAECIVSYSKVEHVTEQLLLNETEYLAHWESRGYSQTAAEALRFD
jgi:hypothetical protein